MIALASDIIGVFMICVPGTQTTPTWSVTSQGVGEPAMVCVQPSGRGTPPRPPQQASADAGCSVRGTLYPEWTFVMTTTGSLRCMRPASDPAAPLRWTPSLPGEGLRLQRGNAL
ncbi:hypothetical protein [Falsiroseomonas ponticola]|uniref:hypothetical protein n=1 Tax=Falsiroseomonas ponticola TaxID=2786951 RepID=UPI0019337F24|nr:hypothetical protein [Roseomonas ponticola]